MAGRGLTRQPVCATDGRAGKAYVVTSSSLLGLKNLASPSPLHKQEHSHSKPPQGRTPATPRHPLHTAASSHRADRARASSAMYWAIAWNVYYVACVLMTVQHKIEYTPRTSDHTAHSHTKSKCVSGNSHKTNKSLWALLQHRLPHYSGTARSAAALPAESSAGFSLAALSSVAARGGCGSVAAGCALSGALGAASSGCASAAAA